MNDTSQRFGHIAPRLNHPNRRPRDAATLVVVDSSGAEPLVLMGRRHDGHAFMPGKFVFPGGRVNPGDSRIAAPQPLDAAVEAKLLLGMKGAASRSRAQALALAAIRETWEETGLLIGEAGARPLASRSPAWRPFVEHGLAPALGRLSYICRAITPPRRARRYDTRFFCVSAEHVAHTTPPADAELTERHWVTAAEAMKLDLPTITRVVLEELQARFAAGGFPAPGEPVPYYYMRGGAFRREMI